MKIIQEQIICQNNLSYTNSNRKIPFNLVKIVFYYQSNRNDAFLLNELIETGSDLATKVNSGAANNAALSRNYERIKNNCIAGVLAEYAWRSYLNKDREIVAETSFESVNNQIDLKIISNAKTIEVRSSFPRNGIEFAICSFKYEFDIIGPYNNNYKPTEIQKDFYIRTLFPFESHLIIEKIKLDGFAIYLTGGATWAMMADNNTAIIKDFIPEDEIDANRLKGKSSYRVVPFSKSLDTLQIAELIKRG